MSPSSPRPPSAPAHALDTLPAVEVERAAMDLRRGLPVVIETDGAAALVMSGELASPRALAQFRTWSAGVPLLVFTRQRAATLKIRLYTGDIAAVPLSEEMTPALITSLADPAHDLDRPLAGPLLAARELPALPFAPAVRLAKIAALLPCVLVAPAGSGADPARVWALQRRLSVCEASAIEAYDLSLSETLSLVSQAALPVDLAQPHESTLAAFRSTAGGPEHYALIIGNPQPGDTPLVRLHSECFTGDLLGSLKCDCGDQLRGAIARMAEDGAGVLLYLAQEGRGIGLMNKLRAYALQDKGFDTVEANERLGFEIDERAFAPAAAMLETLGFSTIRLLTNNPAKVDALEANGITVTERVAHAFAPNPHNLEYLRVKAEKTGHDLPGGKTR